jgi:hypothetical protein
MPLSCAYGTKGLWSSLLNVRYYCGCALCKEKRQIEVAFSERTEAMIIGGPLERFEHDA